MLDEGVLEQERKSVDAKPTVIQFLRTQSTALVHRKNGYTMKTMLHSIGKYYGQYLQLVIFTDTVRVIRNV